MLLDAFYIICQVFIHTFVKIILDFKYLHYWETHINRKAYQKVAMRAKNRFDKDLIWS